jgi:hypothetical protein
LSSPHRLIACVGLLLCSQALPWRRGGAARTKEYDETVIPHTAITSRSFTHGDAYIRWSSSSVTEPTSALPSMRMPVSLNQEPEDDTRLPDDLSVDGPSRVEDVDVAPLVREILRLHLLLEASSGAVDRNEDTPQSPQTSTNIVPGRHGAPTPSVATRLGQAFLRLINSEGVLSKILTFQEVAARKILDAAHCVRRSIRIVLQCCT